jgi:argininosuccinate lyase
VFIRVQRAVKKSPVSRSGRFAGGPGADVAQFTESISFDWRLWRHDILGSMAHATMLHKIGVLTKSRIERHHRGLNAIGREIAAGKFKWKPELEDVHMNIEAELTRRVPAGAKLHTARSRNDQVALDMRLWLRDEITALLGEIADLQRALVSLGEKMPTSSFPATRICNGRSRFISRTICSPTSRCWNAIASGSGIATRA